MAAHNSVRAEPDPLSELLAVLESAPVSDDPVSDEDASRVESALAANRRRETVPWGEVKRSLRK